MATGRRYDPWFFAAWTLLVVVIAFGFFVQARTINRLAEDEDAITDLVTQVEAQQTMNAEALCKLLLVDADTRKEATETVAAFRLMGYTCPRT